MPFQINVPDDGSPRAALDTAGQGVRAFNHRSSQRFDPHRAGWNFVPDVYRCIGELTYLVGMLPQAFRHMADSMRDQVGAGHVAIDAGTAHEGHPENAVHTACASLKDASANARLLYDALSAAQIAINAASYSGPELGHTALDLDL